jgi:dTDP-4-dehydrorhamnose reductase
MISSLFLISDFRFLIYPFLVSKTLLFGSRGYLGQSFLRLFPSALTPSTDIADSAAVAQIFDRERPEVVINCAGKTGRPNVDWCEGHKEETLRANVLGPLVLQHECAKRGVYWVHMSSGCIYEGDPTSTADGELRGASRGFTEDDPPNFMGSFYSRTKAWSDQMLKDMADLGDGILILRIRMPFDGTQSERNLLMKLRKYAKVLDVKNSLTYLPDFEKAAKTLIDGRRKGVYNIVNPGPLSPFELMTLYRDIVDPAHAFERLTIDQLPGVVSAGRSNCVLSTAKLEGEGIILRSALDAAREAMERLK